MKDLPKNYYLILLLSFCISIACVRKESSNKELAQKVDSIFEKWDNSYSPGAAVAIIKDGGLIFKKGYGLANLEYGIPISTSSIFHIASESKQFTAFCIVLLAQKGMLSLDDDIRKYIPEIPDFGEKITIKNLIYHTSGLRDQWQMMAISGTRIDDVITQDHILRMIKNQKRLNFEPGSRMLYCNTGYTLLAEIIKKVSGKSLRKFADDEIFKPLAMKDTHFHDNYKEIVKNRTYSYNRLDSISYENSILSYSTVGATSLFTTVEDEAKWLNNYFTAKVGGEDVIKQMLEPCVLDSGDTLKYAFALEIDKYKGHKRIGHGGADAGYRTYAVRFPEEKIGIVIFSNISDFSPKQIAMKIADIFLVGKYDSSLKNKEEYELGREWKGKFIGKYYNDEGVLLEIIDSTRLFVRINGTLEALEQKSDSLFSIFSGEMVLKFNKNDAHPLCLSYFNNEYEFQRQYPLTLTKAEIVSYTGTFTNDELEAQYEICSKNGNLTLTHNKYEDATLTPVSRNQFSCPNWWMDNIIFQRDSKDKIIGLEINSGRVLHLYFKKIDIR